VSTDAPVIQQAYRFALDPTVEQEVFLAACAGASRFWFNQGLALVKDRLEQRTAGAAVDVPWSYKGLCVAFRGDAVKDQLAPWRSEVVTGSYQAGLEALGGALGNYSAARRAGRKVGFPRFRAKGRSHEAVIFQRPRIPDNRHVDLDRRLGPVRTKESLRKLTRLLIADPQARVTRSTVQRTNGGWVISFNVQRSAKRRRARRADATAGVDVGLARLATLSTGEQFANARPLQAALRALRRLQRQLDRQRRQNNPGNYLPDGCVKPCPTTWVKSQRMLRTEQRIARLHERVANLRRHQAHELTTTLTREFGVIGVETLAVKNMLANRRLARRISDVGWGMVLAQLAYKTSWSDGSILVAADRFYPSSKTCSACGAAKAKLRLAERVFTCDEPACGHVQDRDLNAALNLAGMAHRHAQAEGNSMSYVARIGRFTPTARGGQVSLVHLDEHSPVKREAFLDATQRREALAAASHHTAMRQEATL
jgi:putative transposase